MCQIARGPLPGPWYPPGTISVRAEYVYYFIPFVGSDNQY